MADVNVMVICNVVLVASSVVELAVGDIACRGIGEHGEVR